MKKAVMAVMLASVLAAGGMGGCQGGLAAQDPGGSVDDVVDGIKTQAAEELKKALANEVSAFFKSDDLSKTLGLDSEGQTKIEESLKSYIDQYSMDEEKLREARESLDTVLQNAEGLSAEEIQDKIEGIFKE